MSAKNTTFAAKFNKILPIMSYISVAQYASSEDTKKTASILKQSFLYSRKGFKCFKSFKSNIS